MTVVNPKSISGINSITTGSGSDNLLTIHTSDASSTERVRINSSGDVIVGSGITVSPDGDIFATGVTTSTTFVGALTGNVTGNISGGTVAGSTGTFTGDVDIADKIIHTGDTNTALRFPAADTITAETGGSERARITSGGQVLIGNTADPSDYNSGADDLIIGSHSSASGITILSPTNNGGFIMFSDNNGGGTNAYRGQIEYGHTDDMMRFMTASSERLRIDSSGKVGMGDGTIDGLLTIKGDSDQVGTPSIRLLDGSDTREVSISNTSGDFVVSVHGNDNAIHGHIKMFESGIFTVANGGSSGTNTERLRITTSGGLEQNGGSAAHYVLTNSGKAANHIHIDGPTGNSGEMGGAISFDCGGTGSAAIAGLQQSSDPDKIGLAFIVHQSSTASDNAIEAARFDNDGKFIVGRTGSITIASDPSDHNFEQLTNNGMALALHCDQSDQRGFGIYYTDSKNPSDFIRCQIGSSAKFLVTGNGNTQNANNSYGSISDISLKENIVDANSQWDDIKNIKVRNYNFKESVGHGTHTQIGVVAQELETVSPKLVEVSDKDGMKNVQYSVLYMKSVKALQEAMSRIETLEAKVAALEGS